MLAHSKTFAHIGMDSSVQANMVASDQIMINEKIT